MHLAPAVNFPVKRSRWRARLIVCMILLALVMLSVFSGHQTVSGSRTVGLALVTLIAGTTALLGWKWSPQGNLGWDGQRWYWSGFAENPVCRLRLQMDFQSFMVVTVTANGRAPLSLWIEAVAQDTSWRRLRRAIVSSQAESKAISKDSALGKQGDFA